MKRSLFYRNVSSEFCYPIYKIWKACKDYKIIINDKKNSLRSQVLIECIQWYESHRTKLAKLNNWNSTYKKREDRPLSCNYCMHIKHKKLRFSKLTTKCTKFTANFIAQNNFITIVEQVSPWMKCDENQTWRQYSPILIINVNVLSRDLSCCNSNRSYYII